MNISFLIREEVKRLFEQKTYSIPELAKTAEYQGYGAGDIEIISSLLSNDFKRGGDEAVIKSYAEMTGVQIEALSKGRYIFANLYDPEKNNHQQSVVMNEEKIGNYLYGYHATPCEKVKKIEMHGFEIGDRQMQGRGVYGFYNLNDNSGGNAAIGYGSRHVDQNNFCIIKFRITDPEDIIILDKDIAYDVKGQNGNIITQIENVFGTFEAYWSRVERMLKYEYRTPEYMEEIKAKIIEDFDDKNSKNLMFGTANLEHLSHYGVIFDGEYGMEYLIKQPNLMQPIGYYNVGRENGRLEISELNKLHEY